MFVSSDLLFIQAGLVKEKYSERLLIVSEAEAAWAHCLEVQSQSEETDGKVESLIINANGEIYKDYRKYTNFHE